MDAQKPASKNCFVSSVVEKAPGEVEVVVRFPGGNLYYYDKTNASEHQLVEMVGWGSKPKFLRWLHSQGIVRVAKKLLAK